MTTPDGPGYGKVDRSFAMNLATTKPEDDEPIWMVNLMKYKQTAEYADGRKTTISGREADDLYAPRGPLAAVGATIAFGGDVEEQLLGKTPTWDRIGVVKYASRTSFIAMQSREDFQKQHVHKVAGMQETIVIGCIPMDVPETRPGAEVVDWSDVPHPPTDEDGPVMVMHVIKFNDTEAASVTPEDMQAYQAVAGGVAAKHGVRIAGWLSAEGTIIGDGRSWDQVRFNLFPSLRAFRAVVQDQARMEAEQEHRRAAMADTYTMIVRPMLNQLRASIEN